MLNPILYTEKILNDFLKYQLTAYPFTDDNLYTQMRHLLNLEQTRRTPLFKGPYVSLSRSFQEGEKIENLVTENILHPHLKNLIPYPRLYGHQEQAIRAITAGKTTLVSTGTGSGKTECFLYPIISHCLQLRDRNIPPGITAVIVYPMNALAEDQLRRLRELLAGTGVSFGMYVGKTPERKADVSGKRLAAGASNKDYEKALLKAQKDKQSYAVYPPEERVSREELRQSPPRILLTNIKQLELLLTRQKDIELFNNVQLKFIVFDEAHTFSGAVGAETALLIRRLRAFCYRSITETTCIATSATLTDPEGGKEAGRYFAARFFGVEKDTVELVTEQYQEDIWQDKRTVSPQLPGDGHLQLKTILQALETEQKLSENYHKNPDKITENTPVGTQIKLVFQAMTGQALDAKNWQESLYEHLSENELVYQLNLALKTPRLLRELVKDLETRIHRPVSEAEILVWLALGAASRKEKRPLLRPVIHGFVRGVGGAVVTFPKAFSGGETSKTVNSAVDPVENPTSRPQLWLSGEDIAGTPAEELYRLPITTCTTCGQHYFTHHVADFGFGEKDKQPQGGQAVGGRRIWKPLGAEQGGERVILLDRLITHDDEEQAPSDHPKSTEWVYFCRYCGTLHSSPVQREKSQAQHRCDGCGVQGELVALLAVRQKPKYPGKLTACVTCQTMGRMGVGGYREPIRDVRAVTVSDVHVLAQNMLHHAERRRLLVFADNRQDAAFQAGWMQDHARRYRLRSLMYDRIQQGAVSIGDLTAHLDDLLNADDDLSQSLIPEVWRVHRKEAEGVKHNEERKRFLRIQVLREVATGVKQRIGLEPWGRMRVEYAGITPELEFVEKWSAMMGVSPQALSDGIAALLDVTRRGGVLLDREGRIFSRLWQEGDFEILRGYLPILKGVPRGLKLQREANDHQGRVQQWLSQKGQTVATQAAERWGVDKELVPQFLDEFWRLLTEGLQLLMPATFTGRRNRALSGCSDVRQIDADRLRLSPHRGVYRCQVCRRVHLRPTPRMVCMAWRCRGTIEYEPENPDDYDLMVLDQQFSMLRSREHSAQVPHCDREWLERVFQDNSEQVNTLVCTPTLEMGVNIGSLDAVLMRNVPPLPANYWQRAGRAGRQHRMAVNLTYARQASHDRAYFNEPLKLLGGTIAPPRFNLRNALMVKKHVHATVLTVLHQLMRSPDVSKPEREEIKQILDRCFPPQVKQYLFSREGYVLPQATDVGDLGRLIGKYEGVIGDRVRQVFGEDSELREAVSGEDLPRLILETPDQLQGVIGRLQKRLRWALDQMDRLETHRKRKGTLDPDEEALKRRCDRLVKKLKGIQSRQKREAEGYDDINTYSVLGSEGFLPGYGLEIGSILGTAQVPRNQIGYSDFELPRSTAMALREYVPGNLIYANSNRFVPRFYHLEPEPQVSLFQVDLATEAIAEVGLQNNGLSGLGVTTLRAVSICDVDLPHQSQISDDESYRFQLPVSILGYEQNRHSEGKAYGWGSQTLQLRLGVHLRLVNVGASSLVTGGTLGYDVCLVCGQSRSPLASPADRENFAQDHLERCGQPVEPTGFYADAIADAITLLDCRDREEAYSVAEAIRFGASRVLDMELEDLQVLVIAQPGLEKVDVLLYDPMPGGSGLLDRVLENWEEITSQALDVVVRCSSLCDTACIDCLFTYRNSYYHRYLNRHVARRKISEWGHELLFKHDIPPKLPNVEDTSGQPSVNDGETILRDLLKRAGFPTAIAQHSIDLGRPLGVTTPDFFYEDPADRSEGICIYLDGMSRHLHGNPERQKWDNQIRNELENIGYEVFVIPFGNLSDRFAMTKHFFRLARILLGREEAKQLRDQSERWFESEKSPESLA